MLSSIYNLRTRDILTLCVLGLLLLGVLMVQSASTNVTEQAQWTSKGTKHATLAVVALATFFIVGGLDYGWLGKPTKSIWTSPIFWIMVVCAGANLVVLIPGIGTSENHATRWIKL